MRLLLDTPTLLWWWTDDQELSGEAKRMIADPSVEVNVSAVSAWEIATLERLGRLGYAPDAARKYHELVLADGFRYLRISHLHCLRAGSYEVDHHDPFDRMLAAQSEMEMLTLVTKDAAFGLFGTQVLWY